MRSQCCTLSKFLEIFILKFHLKEFNLPVKCPEVLRGARCVAITTAPTAPKLSVEGFLGVGGRRLPPLRR